MAEAEGESDGAWGWQQRIEMLPGGLGREGSREGKKASRAKNDRTDENGMSAAVFLFREVRAACFLAAALASSCSGVWKSGREVCPDGAA